MESKQAKQRQGKCSMIVGKKSVKKKKKKHQKFTEDRIPWINQLEAHCEEEYEDVEETINIQETRIRKCKTEGGRHFTEEGRVATGCFKQEPRWPKRESTD